MSIGGERFRPGPQLMAYIEGLEYEDAFIKELQTVIEATPRFTATRRKI